MRRTLPVRIFRPRCQSDLGEIFFSHLSTASTEISLFRITVSEAARVPHWHETDSVASLNCLDKYKDTANAIKLTHLQYAKRLS